MSGLLVSYDSVIKDAIRAGDLRHQLKAQKTDRTGVESSIGPSSNSDWPPVAPSVPTNEPRTKQQYEQVILSLVRDGELIGVHAGLQNKMIGWTNLPPGSEISRLGHAGRGIQIVKLSLENALPTEDGQYEVSIPDSLKRLFGSKVTIAATHQQRERGIELLGVLHDYLIANVANDINLGDLTRILDEGLESRRLSTVHLFSSPPPTQK